MLDRCASLVAALVLIPLGASAQATEPPAYRQTIDDAVREFSAGRYEEARALFKSANELSPNARTLRGMGMAAFELRMYVQAIRELDAALAEQRKPLEGEMRTQVEQLKAKAHEFVGRIYIVLEPLEARLLIDGKQIAPEGDGSFLLDLGAHVLSANAERHKPGSIRVSVEGGAEQTIRVQLEPLLTGQSAVPAIEPNAPLSQPTREAVVAAPKKPKAEDSDLDTYAFIALGGAGVLGVTSGVFWAIAGGQYNQVYEACAPICSDQQISDSGFETSDTLSTVFLGLSLASGAAAVVLFAIDAGSSSEEDSRTARKTEPGASFAVRAAPTGVALSGRF